MLTEFSNLAEADQILLMNAPAMITLLVGGADDDLSPEELGKALKTVKIRAYNEDYPLQYFYQRIAEQYDDQVADLAQLLPGDAKERVHILSERLAKLSDVLAQMSQESAYAYYKDLRTFATAVARADGGFLRWITIGPKEAQVVELPMIDPIAEPENQAG